MALFKESKIEKTLPKTSEQLETAQILNSSKVNEKITNNISGYKWKVNYYNQILGKMDKPKQLDTALNITLQPYRLIENLTIILTSPLTSAATKDLNGDGYVDIKQSVHKYDLFIAEVQNKVGIFYVDEVYMDTYQNNTIHKIIFKFFAFTSDVATYENLVNKVATEFIYNDEYKFSNEKAILLKKEVLDFNTGITYVQGIMNHYFQKYYDPKLKLFKDISDKNKTVLDLYLNKFIKSTFNCDFFTWLDRVEYVDIEDMWFISIYDALIKNVSLPLCNKLYISKPDKKYSSTFYREVIRVDAMSSFALEAVDIYSNSYFIPDEFYTTELDLIEDNKLFEIVLFKTIKELDLNLEEIKTAIEAIRNDEYSYFKIPILCFCFIKQLNTIKI